MYVKRLKEILDVIDEDFVVWITFDIEDMTIFHIEDFSIDEEGGVINLVIKQ